MPEHDLNKVLDEVMAVKYELKDLQGKLDDIEKDLRTELNQKIEKTEWEHQNYDRRISFTEKIIFTTAGFILLAVLGALVATVVR